MVVVVLIAILAAIAAPSMVRARNDRLAFEFARRTSELFHAARTRAAGTGAAHLVVFRGYTGSSSRGTVLLFAAHTQHVDEGPVGPTPNPGPNPSATCRNTDWSWANGYTPGAEDASRRITFVDALNITNTGTTSAQTTEDIRMAGFTVDASGSKTPEGTLGLCVTPSGATYFTTNIGSTPLALLTGTLEVDVARHQGGLPIGLTRRVIISGGGQPRIKSE